MKPAFRLATVPVFLISLLSSSISSAYDIKILDWSELSDTKLTPTGSSAFDLYGDAWQHAETAHFVYHFRDGKLAETVLVNAEEYYHWVKETLGVIEDTQKRKAHVFVFDEREDWQAFNARTPEKLPGAEAFTNGFELYLYRDPFFLKPQRALAHEIAHVAVFRFVEGQLPLFLNEGFAEYVATKAVARRADGDEYRVKTFRKIAKDDFIPLEELAAMKSYPSGREEVFYAESEFLARFLIQLRKPEDYYGFLRSAASGKEFSKALEEAYGMDYEETVAKFERYAMTP